MNKRFNTGKMSSLSNEDEELISYILNSLKPLGTPEEEAEKAVDRILSSRQSSLTLAGKNVRKR